MTMPGRSYEAETPNRYGFNGKEKDNDAYSTSVYDYGFRIYNPTIGKFLSVDPLTKGYPWYTPYQFAGNKPIKFIDIDGLEEGVKEVGETKEPKTYTDLEIASIVKNALFSTCSCLSDLFALKDEGKKSINISYNEIFTWANAKDANKVTNNKLKGFIGQVNSVWNFQQKYGDASIIEWDVEVAVFTGLSDIDAVVKLQVPLFQQEEGRLVKSKKVGSTVKQKFETVNGYYIPTYDIDGEEEEEWIRRDVKSPTTLIVETKTGSGGFYNASNIVDGFYKAIATATTINKLGLASNTYISVLSLDYKQFMQAIKDPAQKGVFSELLKQLHDEGGVLDLRKNGTLIAEDMVSELKYNVQFEKYLRDQ